MRFRSAATSAGAGSVPDSIASVNAGGVSTLSPIAAVRYPATFSVYATGDPAYFVLSAPTLSEIAFSPARYFAFCAAKYAAFCGSSLGRASVAAAATLGIVAGSYHTWTLTSSLTPRMSWTFLRRRVGLGAGHGS